MLFDENLGFMPFNLDTAFPFSEKKETKTNKVLDPLTGFLRGNMYQDEFKPYKNYTYRKLEPTSKKDKLLLEVMMYNFAINDLNLSLDLHPDDPELLTLFQKYTEKACEKEMEYVKQYGPLQVTEALGEPFNWLNEPWPWNDREDAKYV